MIGREHAEHALVALRKSTPRGVRKYLKNIDIGEDAVNNYAGDLAVDLCHLAGLNNVDPEDLMDRALAAYYAEVEEDLRRAQEEAYGEESERIEPTAI